MIGLTCGLCSMSKPPISLGLPWGMRIILASPRFQIRFSNRLAWATRQRICARVKQTGCPKCIRLRSKGLFLGATVSCLCESTTELSPHTNTTTLCIPFASVVVNMQGSNSTLFGRQNPLRSQYVDLCCESLKRAREHPSDIFLEHNVRLVQMGEKISEAFGAANDRERGKPYLFLLDDHSRGFRQELDTLMQSLNRQQLRDRALYSQQISADRFADWDRFFTLHYNYLLVRLYEPATFLHEIPEEGGAPSTYRSQCLRSCLFAAKSFFDILFTLPPTGYLYPSINFTEQITFVMVITTRLLLLETQEWDVHFARMTMNFLSVVDRLVQRLDASEAERIRAVGVFVAEMGIEASAAEIATSGRIADISNKMRYIRTWFEKRVNKDELPDQLSQEWPVEELGNRGARAFGIGANGPIWMTGLLSNSAWNFDDVEFVPTNDNTK